LTRTARSRVGDEAALDHLAEAADQLCRRQGGQQVEVADHPGGLVERADEILARTRVDAGLAADRGVDHGQQGRRDVDHPHPAQPGGRDEPADVGGGPTADRDDGVGPGEAGRAEPLPGVGDDGRGLGGLAVGHLQVEDLVVSEVAGQVDGQPGRVHQGDPLDRIAQQSGDPVAHSPADDDVVRRGAGHPDGAHAIASRTAAATSSGERPSVSTVTVATDS
jgi:hypothetical protein